jgi:FkbM family methyltransferase
VDLERARRRGISRRRRGIVTNPARALLWKLMLPYIQDIAENFDMVHGSVRGHDFRFAETDARIEQATAHPPHSIRRAVLLFDGVRKDVAANNHRLEALEARVRGLAEAAPDGAAPDGAALDDARTWLDALAREVRADRERLDAVEAGVRGLAEAAPSDAASAEMRAWLEALAEEVRAGRERLDALGAGRVPVGRDGLVIVSGPHGRFMVWPNDLIGRLVAGGGVWEPHVRAAIERHAQPDRTAIDAGAYIGLHTVHLSRYFREVHAFEPQRGVFQVLCGNLALNACRNVRATNGALYDHACGMRLAAPTHQEVAVPTLAGAVDYGAVDNAAALVFEEAGEGGGPVPATTIDDLRLGDVGFIKVDTQGADLHVLQGAANTIRRCRPVVTFEYERDMAATHGSTREAMLGFFDALDYDVEVLHVTVPDRQVDYIAVPR